MSNQIETSNYKIHELTMFYLKGQDLSVFSIPEIAEIYNKVKINFEDAFKNLQSADTNKD